MVGQHACFLLFVLPLRHRPKEEYTLIYILNEFNLSQNRNGENSLVLKRCAVHGDAKDTNVFCSPCWIALWQQLLQQMTRFSKLLFCPAFRGASGLR